MAPHHIHGSGFDAYSDDVAAMPAGSLEVVRPRGVAALITRPVRERGAVWLATSHLAESLAGSGMGTGMGAPWSNQVRTRSTVRSAALAT